MKRHSMGLAVITGASSGIGAIYADRLARRGYDLLLVARNQEQMANLATKLVSETGSHIEIVAGDLTNPKDMARLEQILRGDSRVTPLVNNAGLGATAPLLNSDVADMSRVIALNVEAVTRLTYAAAPQFVKRGSGAIVNLGSVVAISPELLNGVYGVVVRDGKNLKGRALGFVLRTIGRGVLEKAFANSVRAIEARNTSAGKQAA